MNKKDYKQEYKKLRKILKNHNTSIFGADTNYKFVGIANKNLYYKFSIRDYNLETFNKKMNDDYYYIFKDIVLSVIKHWEEA